MKQRSLTLVEIIISMLILSLILLGMAGIFTAGKRHLKRAEYRQTALNFAREKLEELEVLSFNHLCLSGGTYPTGSCPDTGLLPTGWQRIWSIENVDLDGDAQIDRKNITVRVQWQGPSL